MSDIKVKMELEDELSVIFRVVVIDNGSASTYTVTVNKDDYQHLTAGKITDEELVRRSFEFLLERESKESILSNFNLMEIARYFPQFEKFAQKWR